MIKGKVVKGVEKAVKPAKWSEWKDHITDGIPSDITRHSYVEVMPSSGIKRGWALEFSWVKEFTDILDYRYKIEEDEPLKFESQMKIDEKPKHPSGSDDDYDRGHSIVWPFNFNSDTPIESAAQKPMHELYPDYYRDVSKLESIDTYRINDLFTMTDSMVVHAAKKLILAGGRTGEKSYREDIKEARDTLSRRLEMWAEDEL